jgi:hypothetical protein
MSATCDVEMFAKYFEETLNGEKLQVPSINCPFHYFKVNEFYLDDLKKHSNVNIRNAYIILINKFYSF